MIKFKDKNSNQIKEAYCIKEMNNKILVQFTKKGTEYAYSKNSIEFISIVYEFERLCYRCGKQTKILTYIKFPNGDDLTYPWDKERLNAEKSFEQDMLHMVHSEIEFYPIKVIGFDEILDNIMLEKFPSSIKNQYSKTQNRMYPMNICDNCGAKQGGFFIYKELNEKIISMQKIKIHQSEEAK